MLLNENFGSCTETSPSESASMKSLSKNSHQKTKKPKTRIPSYIFKRGDFYYFRFTLPKKYWNTLCREIYLSLRTPYRKKAISLA
ncbi:MAG: hypothetical protein LBJ61_08960, partial [Deltaproteobacteria bacterium]|nr:hypothetical protein [Deltaproteobacteria bacterium]